MAGDVRVCVWTGIVLSLFVCILSKPTQLLFTENDNIVILNGTTFNKTVHGSGQAWIVNFYNSWCGHCIRFAPLWKELGSNTTGWRGVIQVASVDCSLGPNSALCRDYDIQSYPTLQFFPAHCSPATLGSLLEDRNQLQEKLIDYVMRQESGVSAETRRVLSPLVNMEDVWNEKDGYVKYVILIFEERHSYIGSQVILDVWSHRELLVRRMLREDVVKFGISRFPSMFHLETGGMFKPLGSSGSREEFTRSLLKLVGGDGAVVKSDESPGDGFGQWDNAGDGSHRSSSQDKFILPKAQDVVYIRDIESALSYSLRHEVAGHLQIDGEELHVLQSYISVLAKCYPGRNTTLQYLQVLDDWLKRQEGRILGASWLETVNSFQTANAYLEESESWIGCHGSQPKYRGYPCGLWILFHALTVNCAISQRTDNPTEVLLAMRGYIKIFFGCRECSKNFAKGAAFIEEKVHTSDDSILFLWQSHNRANFHLHGDITEDPEHIKVQFPPASLCKDCQTSKAGETIQWNEKAVLEFLKNMYSKDHILLSGSVSSTKQRREDLSNFGAKQQDKKKLEQETLKRLHSNNVVMNTERTYLLQQKERASRSEVNSGQMSGFDVSLCLIFYVLCSAIIILLYFYFLVKRRMHLCPNSF